MPARDIFVAGTGAGFLSYELPAGVEIDVESVLANVDASAAGDTIATLYTAAPGGETTTAVPQGQPVSGGVQGRATWALRLGDDGGGSGPAGAGFEAIRDPVGVLVAPGISTFLPWFRDFGASFLSPNGANQPALLAGGTYAFMVNASGGVSAASYDIDMRFRIPRSGATFQSFATTARWITGMSSGSGPTMSVTKDLAAGDSVDVLVRHNAAGNRLIILQGAIERWA